MRLRCYAEGRPGDWQAICLDLDIAVQGGSFDEVRNNLNSAIALFIEEVKDSSAANQRRLLSRKAPLWMRLKYAWQLIKRDNGGGGNSHANERHEYSYPVAA